MREVWVRCSNQGGMNEALHGPWSPLVLLLTGMESARFLQICWEWGKKLHGNRMQNMHILCLWCVCSVKASVMWIYSVTVLLIWIKATVVHTWGACTAHSEWSHRIDVIWSQKLFIGCSSWNLLEALSGVLEEEIFSCIWLEQFEWGITATGAKLGLQIETKSRYKTNFKIRKKNFVENDRHTKINQIPPFWILPCVSCFHATTVPTVPW